MSIEINTKGDFMKFKDFVRFELYRQGKTQVGLAKGIGISRSALDRKLRGYADFKVGELIALGAELGVPVHKLVKKLLSEENEKTRSSSCG